MGEQPPSCGVSDSPWLPFHPARTGKSFPPLETPFPCPGLSLAQPLQLPPPASPAHSPVKQKNKKRNTCYRWSSSPCLLEFGIPTQDYIVITEISVYAPSTYQLSRLLDQGLGEVSFANVVLFHTDTCPCARTRAITHFQREIVLILETSFNFQLT